MNNSKHITKPNNTQATTTQAATTQPATIRLKKPAENPLLSRPRLYSYRQGNQIIIRLPPPA